MDTDVSRKLAVLIDAENISNRYAKLILDEAAGMGTVICKRIYADWSNTASSSWKKAVMDYSIQPIQQFSYASGKNSTDSALIIDAMDLLHTGKLQGFCIVSSDSDFTKLASRLRESEMLVIGMGEKKTPASFRSACDKFLYLDVLFSEATTEEMKASEPDSCAEASEVSEIKTGMDRDEIARAIDKLVAENSDDEGWYFLGALGKQLLSQYPDFDPRNFGFAKLNLFVKDLGGYEFRTEKNPSKPNLKLMYIRKNQHSTEDKE